MKTATITLENVSDEFVKVFKELAKIANAKFKVDKPKERAKRLKNAKIPNDETLKAAQMCEKGHCKRYASFGDFWDEVQKEVRDEARA